MDSIFGRENAEKLREKYTVLDLETVEKDGVSQWFAEQNMQKYINVNCILINDFGKHEYLFDLLNHKCIQIYHLSN